MGEGGSEIDLYRRAGTFASLNRTTVDLDDDCPIILSGYVEVVTLPFGWFTY